MRSTQSALAAFLVVMASTVAGANPGPNAVLQPQPRLFGRLFAGDAGAQQRAEAPPRTAERERRANRECAGCEGRPGETHLVIDSPRLTDDWIARHTYQANGSLFGDNAAIADFWYDAVHRRLFTRSLVLHEVEDPADLRLGRAPGTYPNEPDFRSTLNPGTTVGHVGFVRWSNNGFGSYFAAVQGAVRDVGTGYLDLSTVTGETGTTRTGSAYGPEDLIKHVRLHPSGQLEVGFETNPEARPDTTLVVRGNARIEGSLTVEGTVTGGSPPAAPLACTVRDAIVRGRSATASCSGREQATGGGGSCASGELRASRPLTSSGKPGGWEVSCSREGGHAVYVVCCTR